MTIGLRICIVFSMVFGCYLNGMYNKENKTNAFLGSMCVAALHTRFVRIIQQDGTRCTIHKYILFCRKANKMKEKLGTDFMALISMNWTRDTRTECVAHCFHPFWFCGTEFSFISFSWIFNTFTISKSPKVIWIHDQILISFSKPVDIEHGTVFVHSKTNIF